MKNFIYLALIPIIAVFLADRIKASPDLIYSLSKEIRVQGAEKDSFENIRQLEVKNVGNDVAKNIIIKVAGDIEGASVEKFSAEDDVAKNLSHENLEVKYKSLMPGGSFFVVLKTKNSMTNSRLNIVYENGKAVDAFSKEINVGEFLIIFIGVFFILQLATSFYSGYKDMLMRDARSYLSESLLKRKKPLIINDGFWQKIILTSKATLLSDFYKNHLQDIEASVPYKFLNSDINSIRDISIKQELTKTAYRALENLVDQKVSDYRSLAALEKMLLIVKPAHLPESNWIEILSNIQEKYIFRFKQDIIADIGSDKLYNSTDFRLDLLRKDAQDGVEKFINYFNICKSKIILSRSDDVRKDFKEICKFIPKSETLASYNLAKNLLFANIYAECTQKNVKPTIEANSDWLERIDSNFITQITNEVYWALNFYKVISKVLDNKSVKTDEGLELGGRQLAVVEKVESILKREAELGKKENEVEEHASTLKATKGKVLTQLQFIDTLLSKPLEIDRIEDYEDTFSSVNYINLKKIAQILINGNT
jgi:hypothetical protein